MANNQSASEIKNTPSPIGHIAFIMDGNGRWAKKRLLPREAGHRVGAEVFQKIVRRCCEHNIPASTYYVFSTENWKRPKKEVDAIINLLDQYLDQCEKELLEENNIRFIFIGKKDPFAPSLREKMLRIEENSKNNRFIVNLALNYGARDELVTAFEKLAADGKTKITEADITEALYTRESPELDLIVRTGGDFRLSNFLLWQAAYAEFCFTDTLWPDFNVKELDQIIEEFKNRNRRFGGVTETEE